MSANTLVTKLLTAVLILGATGLARAQMAGLPVLDTAGTREPGNLELTPGVVVGEDANFYGARGTITVLDELRGFLDLGRLDTDRWGDSLAAQVGALYSLPMTEYFETAIRGALYYSNTDHMDLLGGNLMLVCSDETLLDGLYAYSGVGADLSQRTIYRKDQTELNPALALGLTYKITDSFWLFLEGNYVDTFSAACGLGIR